MIPKSFTLINTTYDVLAMAPHMEYIANAVGAHNQAQGLIYLNKEVDVTKNSLEHTFYHELVHAILSAAGQDKMSDDEELVDLLGAILHQYEQTKKGQFDANKD